MKQYSLSCFVLDDDDLKNDPLSIDADFLFAPLPPFIPLALPSLAWPLPIWVKLLVLSLRESLRSEVEDEEESSEVLI